MNLFTDISRCCKMHDLCYDRAIGEGKCKDVAAAYFTPYDWQCVNSTVVCTSMIMTIFHLESAIDLTGKR